MVQAYGIAVQPYLCRGMPSAKETPQSTWISVELFFFNVLGMCSFLDVYSEHLTRNFHGIVGFIP